LLVVDAEAIVDEADIGGIALGSRQQRLESRGVDRLLGGCKGWCQQAGGQEQAEGDALHVCAGCRAIDPTPLSSRGERSDTLN
jgi:hypothetical protein